MEQLIQETNQIRKSYASVKKRSDYQFLSNIEQSIRNTRFLLHQPCVEQFLKDVQHSIANQGISLTHTKSYINQANDQFLFSVFESPYFPDLSIEACFYDVLAVDDVLEKKYKTNVMPVNIKMASEGFYSRPVVALFPENHIDKIQLSEDKIFYFINKFVDRFYKITHKMIKHVVADGFFDELVGATPKDIESASVYWVWLHEYHHRQGYLPLPQYLKLKTFKPLAGLEELRVDMCGIMVCLDDQDLPPDRAKFVSRFILAERLLRYAVEGIPKPNYDAIASQLLFNFLREKGGIFIRDMKIHFTDQIFETLRQFAGSIHDIESRVQSKDPKEVQHDLLQFTKKYTNFNEEDQDFYHIEYFKQIKEMLNV